MNRSGGQIRRRPGFILTEACVSLALVGMVLGMASLLLSQHGRATEYFLNYRRAQLAAATCVERMRIGALDIVETGFCDGTGIHYQVRVKEASEEWKPLRLVEALAFVDEKRSFSAQYSLRAYLALPHEIRGDKP